MEDTRPLKILLVEDSEDDKVFLTRFLNQSGFDVKTTCVETSDAFRSCLAQESWDLVISDFTLPTFSGVEALTIFKELQMDIPFFIVSGSIGEEKAVEVMKFGARDYIMKDNITRLAPAILRELSETKKKREQKQTTERLERLSRFFSPQISDLIMTEKLEDPFKWHRKDVTILFIDLRGFTNFVEVSELDVVVTMLQEYYSQIANLVQKYVGTVGHVAGDGVMIIFNDPISVEGHQQNAVRMALELRATMAGFCRRWSKKNLHLNFGAGLAHGEGVVGGTGIQGCWDFSVFGSVTNLAARLCQHAQEGQVLIPQSMLRYLNSEFMCHLLDEVQLRGFQHLTPILNVVSKSNGKASDGAN